MRGKPDADPGSEVEDSGSFLERPEADDPGAIVYVCVSVLLLPRDRCLDLLVFLEKAAQFKERAIAAD